MKQDLIQITFFWLNRHYFFPHSKNRIGPAEGVSPMVEFCHSEGLMHLLGLAWRKQQQRWGTGGRAGLRVSSVIPLLSYHGLG